MVTLANGIGQCGRIPVLNVNVLLMSECFCVVDIRASIPGEVYHMLYCTIYYDTISYGDCVTIGN